MLLSMPTSVLSERIGVEKTIQLIKNAGFDAFDFSQFDIRSNPDSPLNRDNYAEYAHSLRQFADKAGIQCNQSHAPFPSSCGDAEKDGLFYEQIIRSIEIASILGAKIIVVHPKQHLRYARNAKKLIEINREFYRSLIPYAEKYNIKIAVENMWQSKKVFGYKIIDSTCSSPEEFCEYIDFQNSPWICGCLDIGHIPLVRRDISDFILKMGARIEALHVHDNNLLRDNHTFPYLNKIDYEPVLKALHDIGYQGDLTFEANYFFKRVPDDLLLPAAKYLAEIGRYMISQITAEE